MKQFREERKQGVGFLTALGHFAQRRHLPLFGYLLLAVVVAITIGQVQSSGENARADLRAAAVEVVVSSCERDNQTRAVLRGILEASFASTRQYVKEGTITEEQGKRADEGTRAAIKQLGDTNCDAVGEKFRLRSIDDSED